MKLLLAAIFFIILFSFSVTAQDFFQNSSICLTGHYGYILAHREKIENIVLGHTFGFEISLLHQTDGSKAWQVVHNYPQTGFSFVHLNLANEELLGDANALVAFINLPFIRNKNFLFSLHIASGLGYLSKRWQRTEEYKNLAISSHVNAAVQFMAETRYRISKNLFMNLNYGITHFSNGAYHVPNLGINNISLNGGIAYQFSEPEKYLTPEFPPLDKRWQLDILYGFGVKETLPPAGKQFFAHTLCVSFLKPFTYASIACIGMDFFYDLSLQRVITDAADANDLRKKMFRSGIHVGYEMLVNKFTLLLHMGVYIIDEVKTDGNFYHRVGLKYAFTQHFFGNLSLKTHYFRADFVELGAGWKFKMGKNKE